MEQEQISKFKPRESNDKAMKEGPDRSDYIVNKPDLGYILRLKKKQLRAGDEQPDDQQEQKKDPSSERDMILRLICQK
ncbi:hypothetical protein BpHYR1_039488 [Brachionus plicatilis]|uniref:Uncharacterized protein n=1 Tax=Brachionus plicatilis TaxID=10195 RepID=A0A3M7PCI9_BRAPC|nr:hypothetical protein BpHYR1_039488 [Brachionus plicatilis]